MYKVELFERGKGTSFVSSCDSRESAFVAIRADARERFGSCVEGVYASVKPTFEGIVASYRVPGREVWYQVYLGEVLNG
jgi:hypothetical protein